MFSFMVTFLLFFQNSTRFIVCIGYQPPFKNTTALFLVQSPPLPHLFRQSINCSVRVSCLPQFKIRKSDIFGQKNEVSKTANMWLQGQIDFFYVTLRKCTFSHELISSFEYANIVNNHRYYYTMDIRRVFVFC